MLLDDDDVLFLLARCLQIDGNDKYPSIRPKRRAVHRELLLELAGAPPGSVVDHINGNVLDNRRCNLRVCLPKENTRNRTRTVNKTGYKGVKWSKSLGRYVATVVLDGKRHHAGTSVDVVKAAKKYDATARRLHGDFASPNFACGCPPETVCQECGSVRPAGVGRRSTGR